MDTKSRWLRGSLVVVFFLSTFLYSSAVDKRPSSFLFGDRTVKEEKPRADKKRKSLFKRRTASETGVNKRIAASEFLNYTDRPTLKTIKTGNKKRPKR